jgi:hypothetical protein
MNEPRFLESSRNIFQDMLTYDSAKRMSGKYLFAAFVEVMTKCVPLAKRALTHDYFRGFKL